MCVCVCVKEGSLSIRNGDVVMTSSYLSLLCRGPQSRRDSPGLVQWAWSGRWAGLANETVCTHKYTTHTVQPLEHYRVGLSQRMN